MSESVCQKVRRSCQVVAERARYVEIDSSALAVYAAALPPERLMLPEMDPAIHYLGHGDDTVAYYLTLDAINFGSGYFPEVLGDPRRSGYRTIASALNDLFAQRGPIPPEKLRVLTPLECASALKLPPTTAAAAELHNLFAASLNDLGALLCDRFDGSFTQLVQDAGGSAARLVEILASIPSFCDVAGYRGATAPFYKRAQLTAVDLFIAFAGQEVGSFSDIDDITICADNLVPHVLRLDGVLHYEEGLAARVDRGELLPAGCEEEVEIRACAVHAGELLVGELRQSGRRVNALMLDNLLWHRGQEPMYRARPRHRTRTVFY